MFQIFEVVQLFHLFFYILWVLYITFQKYILYYSKCVLPHTRTQENTSDKCPQESSFFPEASLGVSEKNGVREKREETNCVSTVANETSEINKFSILASVVPERLDYR